MGPMAYIALKSCQDAGIATVEAGKNIVEARKIMVKKIHGLRIGVKGITEHEFSIANRYRCGVNPFDIVDYVRNLKFTKKI
jgi:hypothetical protein